MSLEVWSYFVLQKALYETDLNLCYCIFFFEICEKWGGMGGDKMQLKILITERPEIPEQLKRDLKWDILPLMPLKT